MLAMLLLAGVLIHSPCQVAAAAGSRNALQGGPPAVDDADLKKMIRGILTVDPNSQTKYSPSRAATYASSKASHPPSMNRHAVMQALAESMGYGGEEAVDNLRATLGSINDDMASLPSALLANSFARTIAGALSLSLAVAPLTAQATGDDVVVHAVGAAEGREGAALEHMTTYLSEVDFGDISGRKNVRIVMIGPEWSQSAHKQTTVLRTDSKQIGVVSVITYRGLYSAETLHDLALPPPTAVICFNCDIYHCHWRPSLLFMIAQAR